MGQLNKSKMAAEDRLPKRIRSYPALLIGQLAVSMAPHQTKHIGSHMCDFCFDRAVRLTKILGCRFLVGDSVEIAVKFYESYGFVLAPKQDKEK